MACGRPIDLFFFVPAFFNLANALPLLLFEFIPKKSSIFVSGVPRNFVRGEGGWLQHIQLRTEDKENGDLREVAP